jgi:hypothetical protein
MSTDVTVKTQECGEKHFWVINVIGWTLTQQCLWSKFKSWEQPMTESGRTLLVHTIYEHCQEIIKLKRRESRGHLLRKRQIRPSISWVLNWGGEEDSMTKRMYKKEISVHIETYLWRNKVFFCLKKSFE